MNRLLTVKNAAYFLGVTQIHLRNLLKRGKISFINVANGKIRKSIRIEKKIIDEFIKNGGVK